MDKIIFKTIDEEIVFCNINNIKRIKPKRSGLDIIICIYYNKYTSSGSDATDTYIINEDEWKRIRDILLKV